MVSIAQKYLPIDDLLAKKNVGEVDKETVATIIEAK